VWNVSDEHTVLHRIGDGPAIKLGDKALLIPSHCDPTVNLHDWIVAVRKAWSKHFGRSTPAARFLVTDCRGHRISHHLDRSGYLLQLVFDPA